ncbi:unannotated protein [freshwater metagenome]|uniref:Unannotated protein n=1 Tax=freshwater metagenome TaxID=449393 RepID=A0A6J7EE22_9ZZZZ
MAVAANLSPAPRGSYRIGLPFAGRWTEILNTDSAAYGGSGMGNLGAVVAVPEVWNERPASAEMVLPPLSTVYLSFTRTQ